MDRWRHLTTHICGSLRAITICTFPAILVSHLTLPCSGKPQPRDDNNNNNNNNNNDL